MSFLAKNTHAKMASWKGGKYQSGAKNLLLFLWAGVQPTLDPCAEAFCDRPIALTQEGRSLVDDVCECVHA